MIRRVGGLAAMLCIGAALGGFTALLAAEPTTLQEAKTKEKSAVLAPKPVTAPKPQPPIAKQKDGTLLVAGRALRCGRNRHVLDRGLPNLGLAAPGVLVFNPRELNRWGDTVRLFVYHHECGHHKVGASEMGADCWAVKQGVRDGWLTADGLAQVCRSFGGGPATSTHPSSASRCASLNRCFTTAVAALAREKAIAAAKAGDARSADAKSADAKAVPTAPPDADPKLVQEPKLKRSGMRPSSDEK